MMAEKKETVFRDNVKNQYFAALAGKFIETIKYA